MDVKRILSGLLGAMSLLVSLNVFAAVSKNTDAVFANAHRQKSHSHGHWFIGASTGIAWLGASKNTALVPNGSVYAPPQNQNDLYFIHAPSADVIWGAQAGYRWAREQRLFPAASLALNYLHISNFNLSGNIEQYSLPAFTTYHYKATVSPNLFALLGKLDLYRYRSVMPYVSFGLGIGFSGIERYSETAFSSNGARNSPGYLPNTNVNFAYTLGFGLDYVINHQLWLSLGYDYVDFGNLKSGRGVATWSGDDLKFGNLSSNTLLLSVIYQLSAV